jgi:hypothetical protein
MPRTNRNIPWRTVLLPLTLAIFLLTIFPMGVRAAAGDANPFAASAREFARRVAASFPAGTRVAIEVRNRSSLAASDAAAVRESILGELVARGLRVTATATESADVAAGATITLSENTAGFLWVAEIHQADRSSVLLMAVPRASATPSAENPGITLRSALLWSGSEHVLAAAIQPPPPANVITAVTPAATSSNLLLLVTDGVTASLTDAQHTFKIVLPPADVGRDPQGSLTWTVSGVAASVGGETCAFTAPLASSQTRCQPEQNTNQLPSAPMQFGSQRVGFPTACGGSSAEFLAAGTGDYTQPDTVRAYDVRDGALVPMSPALEFPGPILSLQAGTSAPPVAVIHNLQSGDDEVYEISIACGH